MDTDTLIAAMLALRGIKDTLDDATSYGAGNSLAGIFLARNSQDLVALAIRNLESLEDFQRECRESLEESQRERRISLGVFEERDNSMKEK